MGWLIVSLLIASASTARAADFEMPRPVGEFLEAKPNAYRLGVNSDQYGRPHLYRTPDDAALVGILTGGARRNA